LHLYERAAYLANAGICYLLEKQVSTLDPIPNPERQPTVLELARLADLAHQAGEIEFAEHIINRIYGIYDSLDQPRLDELYKEVVSRTSTYLHLE
jgi:hypothetical protein